MKGDFSRINGLKAKRKHFSAVLKQQGRVQLDSDWNELIAIEAHQQQTRTIDTIGYAGVPKHHGGFDLFYPLSGGDLFFGAGRMYVGGLLCETTPATKLKVKSIAAPSEIRLDDLHIEGVKLAPGQWLLLQSSENPIGMAVTIASVLSASVRVTQNIAVFVGHTNVTIRRLLQYSKQSDLPGQSAYAPVAGQKDLAYLEVWERHITAIEDPEIKEIALGGPDTDTRTKIVTQLKLLRNVGNVQCSDSIAAWNTLLLEPNGRMSTSLKAAQQPNSPCELGESGGFQGLENRLYRVEIHSIDSTGRARFKWSRDNGAYAFGISTFIPESGGVVKKITLTENGKDALLNIKRLDWIEVSGDETELDSTKTGTLVQVLDVLGNTLTLSADIQVHQNEHHPKVRRWDTSPERLDVLTIVNSGKIGIEDGIEIEFSGTEFKAGAYWVFAARTLSGNIEILDKEAPLGIKRHFCRLGILTAVASGGVTIEDCRLPFPPLTELPEGGDGCCFISISPSNDWFTIFASFKLNQDINICFEPGEYLLRDTILLDRLGHITFSGAGRGSHIRITGHESAFTFKDCKDVCIRDLAFSSEHPPSGEQVREESDLNGVLTILNCEDVTLENVFLTCAHSNSQEREATCVTVRTDVGRAVEIQKTTTVNIRHSEFVVGAFQTGILVVNSDISFVEANRVRAHDTAAEHIAYQGITIAGQMGRNIRVVDNTVEGALQGIHLGFSNNKLEQNGEFFEAGTVHISGNYVLTLMLNQLHASKERHGIFVGNSNSILLNDNFITLLSGKFGRRFPTFIGINIVGHWGRRMVVRHNHLQGRFGETGIVVNAIPNLEAAPFWIVEGNVATVQADDPQIIVRENV